MQLPGMPLISRSASNFIAWAGILGLSAIAIFFSYSWSERDSYAQLDDASANQLNLYIAGLESELGKYEFLPSIIQLDSEVPALLESPAVATQVDKVNKRLTNYNVRAGSITMFVLDTAGIVRASSNWYQPQSLVGTRLAAETWFSDAMEGRDARFFAADRSRNSSDYYFAQPIRKNGMILGVAAVKISLEPIESIWVETSSRARNERILLVDENGAVIISSAPDWKFKSAVMSSQPALPVKPERDGSKPLQPPDPLDIVVEQTLDHGTQLVRLAVPVTGAAAGAAPTLYVAQERSMILFGLRMIILSDASEVRTNARRTAVGTGAVCGFLGLLWMYLLQRRRVIAARQRSREALQRAHDELELRVSERTAELQKSNVELVHEIVERKRMEEVLREAQDELVQATKLALLGQLSAGITHEINQPLTAMLSLSHNTQQLVKLGRIEDITRNLESISDLTERMVRITAQLKTFARKTPLTNRPVQLARAVENGLTLMENRIRSERIKVQVDIPSPLTVFCDSNRLEQVLLNLFANAFDAMKGSVQRTLSIRAAVEDGRALIQVADSGGGIPEATMHRLFEPFFSTKPLGEGLGLGLVISSSIVQEFGGVLRAVNIEGGSSFEFHLHLAEENTHV